MKTTIFYFSATGNSLKVARDIAQKVGNAELVPISRAIKKPITLSSDAIGLVFPVYAWGLPLIVADFITKLPAKNRSYFFAVATCGGSVARTLTQTEKMLNARGIKLSAGFKLPMPGNYTPLYGAISEDKQKQMFQKEKQSVKNIVDIVKQQKQAPINRGHFLTNWLLSGIIYKQFMSHVKRSDTSFWVTDKCNGCGVCQKICPVENIRLIDKKPAWLHKCEQCLACLHWCPEQAIQFGKKTLPRKRYHHPDIKPSDLY